MISVLTRQFDDPVASRIFKALDWKERALYVSETFSDDVKVALKAMEYDVFLNTVYWKIIHDFVGMKGDWICSRCKRRGKQVHHKTYEHHGEEHRFLDDLELICGDCHHENHDPVYAEIKELITGLARIKCVTPERDIKENPNYDFRFLQEVRESQRREEKIWK